MKPILIIKKRVAYLLLLLLVFTFAFFEGVAQKESQVCDNMLPFCTTDVITFPTSSAAPLPIGDICADCLGVVNSPTWFFMQIQQSGSIVMELTNPQNVDVDFLLLGGFESPSSGCGLLDDCAYVEDCSWSGAATEIVTISNGQVGEIYILLITVSSNQYCDMTFQQIGGTGELNCNMVFDCSIISVSTVVGECILETGTFNLDGNVDFTNAPDIGTLIVEEVTSGQQLTFAAPFVSPQAYSFTGIPCDGEEHIVKAWFSEVTTCEFEKTYDAPSPECPIGTVSTDAANICYNGTNPGIVKINVVGGIAPYTFKWSKDGTQTVVSDYSGPFPYEIEVIESGGYKLDTVWDINCGGDPTAILEMIIRNTPPANSIKHH